MSPSNTLLIFKQGYFYLYCEDESVFDFEDRTLWEVVQAGIYRTPSLKAARAFRRFSSSVAERVFDRAFAKSYLVPDLPPLSFLDPHQIEGVKWILSGSRKYIAHAPGAGKTAELIVASILSEGTGPTLFIVPPTLTVNWEREILAFTEHFGIWPAIGIVPASNRQEAMAWGADFIICPDSMLAKEWVINRLSEIPFKFIGVDEASRFKEPTTERGLAFYGGKYKGRVFNGIYQKARHVVFADGSPMPNRPMELWAPTYALHPEAIDCMEQRDFGFRFCGAKMNDRGNWEFNHSSNEDDLRAMLQRDFMHVVTEEQLPHPERLRSLLFMNQDVRTPEHKSWERKHLTALSFDDLSEDMSQGEIAHYRRELGVRKVPWSSGYVRDRLENKNESILLFAWHREVCEALAEKLSSFDPVLVMGGTRKEAREAGFKDFQAGRKNLIVGNIAAMGRGHNLQRAGRVVFTEYSWTDELNKQCEKRASRRGRDQNDSVRCDYIVNPNSMDEPVLNSLFTKQRRVKRVIG